MTGVILLSICGLLLAIGITIHFRNNAVLAYCLKMIDEIYRTGCRLNEASLKRRYDEMEKVSYESMVFLFWRPLDSFYPDKSFLN